MEDDICEARGYLRVPHNIPRLSRGRVSQYDLNKMTAWYI